MSRSRWIALAFCLATALAALLACALRVVALERSELEFESAWNSLEQLSRAPGSTRVSARLAELELTRGENALFEICMKDRLEPSTWRSAFELAVFHLPALELMLRVPLDDAHLANARRSAHAACLPLGGGRIQKSGRYSLDAVFTARPPPAAVRGVPLRARVLGRSALVGRDRGYVLALGLAVQLALALLLFSAPPEQPAPGQPSKGAGRGASAALAVAGFAALYAALQLPAAGSGFALLKGVGLVAFQLGLGVGLGRTLGRSKLADSLALSPPRHALAWAGAALIAAGALFASARLALRLVPATGEAPIQSFVSWPSGLLCFAALGVVLPIGEELFFRGYLYRVALRLGRAAAFFATWLAFVALHAEQSFGNWGGLLSIAITGAVLTFLRARSGSLLVPALAHVLYNFALSMASF